MDDLAGKVALVTGGSRGIGAAIAARLADDGADVAITYAAAADRAAKTVAGIEGRRRWAVAIAADSADPAAVRAAVDRTVAQLGRLDILVNNAGVFASGPIEDVTQEQYDRTFDIHVRAPFVAAQHALRHLPDGGRIVTIGTNFADHVPWPGLTLYTASKAALAGFTRALAREVGPRGITVNLVQPGSTDTDMNPADNPLAAQQIALNPLGRFGAVDDVAAAVAYLAGTGGRHVTGTTLTVDGGTNS